MRDPARDPIDDAVTSLRERLDGRAPRVGLVLGSGLGGLADEIEDAVRVAYGDIPGFGAASVHGHAGQLVVGALDGRPVAALAGRFHIYEGHSAGRAALPVRVLHRLGVETLVVSNAAGGVRRSLRPGDLMLIDDHINLMWRNPLLGPARPGEARYPDMSAPYDRELLSMLRFAALDTGIPVIEGVYAGATGPSYETPAEVRMLQWLGADAVGMSTVPEVIAAAALGLRVAGVSCISNHAAGLSTGRLSHDEVLRTTGRVARTFRALVLAFLKRLPR